MNNNEPPEVIQHFEANWIQNQKHFLPLLLGLTQFELFSSSGYYTDDFKIKQFIS